MSPLTKDLQGLSHCDDYKQKCDGMNACTPCAKLDGGSDCVNERNLVTKRIHKLPPVVQPPLSTFDICGSVFSSTNANSSHVSSESSRSPQPDKSDSPIPQERSTSEMQLVPFREESPKFHQPRSTGTPIFFIHPSLRFPSICQLHIPLQPPGPKHLQVSDTTSSELDLSLCTSLFSGYSTQI